MTCGRCVVIDDAYELDERDATYELDERDEINAVAIVIRMSLGIHKIT